MTWFLIAVAVFCAAGILCTAAGLDVTYHDDGTITVKPKTVVTPLPVPPISPTT